MESKLIEVNGKSYTIKELKYKDIASFADMPKDELAKKTMLLSTEMTEEEYNDISMKEGVELQAAINELNGLADFQQPPK